MRLQGLVGVPGEGLDAELTPVFFMTEVKLLRMELIFARSTFARLGKTKAGEGDRSEVFMGFGRGVAAVVGTVAGVHGKAFETLSVDFVGTEVETAGFSRGFSFLSSTMIFEPSSSTSESSMSCTSRLSVTGSGVADFSLSMAGDWDSSPPIP